MRLGGWWRAASAAALLACSVPTSAAAQAAGVRTPRPPQPAGAVTGGAQDVQQTSAVLEGVVDPHGAETIYSFQYGPTTAYGSQTPAASAGGGTVGVKVSQIVSGLPLGTTYHYRLVATSPVSAVSTTGVDRTFTTKQIALKFVLPAHRQVVPYGKPFTIEGTLSGTGGANRQIVLQASPFPYLTGFGDLGSPASTSVTGGFSLGAPSLAQNAELRLRTLDALPTYSPVVNVEVSVLVTLRTRPSRTPGLVRLSGAVTPAEVGSTVQFQLSRAGRRPSTVATATVRRGNARSSQFSALVSIRHTGFYSALVKVTNGRQTSGSSRAVRIRGFAPPRRARHRR
jgi:hypothetical protein